VTAQVRLYRIAEGRMDEFIAAWRDGIVPLRRSSGYRIEGAWASREGHRFAWVVAYDGPLSWEEAEERYYASPERAAIDPDPATLVEESETWLMAPVPFDTS
jgi:NIPSNAP